MQMLRFPHVLGFPSVNLDSKHQGQEGLGHQRVKGRFRDGVFQDFVEEIVRLCEVVLMPVVKPVVLDVMLEVYVNVFH